MVKIHVAKVVSKDIRNLFGSLVNMALKIFLGPLFDLTDLIVAIEVILFVFEFNLAVNLIVEGTHHDAIESILWMVASYGLAVMKFELFVTNLINVDGVNGELNTNLVVSRELIFAIGAFYEDVRDWRMMRSLLDVNICSITALSLVSLAQNWVQRLFKALALSHEANGTGHDYLEPF